MLILSFWDDVGEAIIDAIRSLMLSLCEIIYKLIVFFFDIFMTLGNGTLLNDATIQEIYQRVGLILGLFMIFRVTFALIQYVMNPDMMIDKQKGLFNIVKKIFIVVILLGTTPSIFKMAYDVQKLVVDSNIIPKVITGKNIDTKDSGTTLAWNSFESFYKFNNEVFTLYDENDVYIKCPELRNNLIKNDFEKNNSLRYSYNCVNEKLDYVDSYNKKTKFYVIDFEGNGFVAVVVGLIILWVIIMYVIQVGIRVVQLSYLQLIAPIPIIMYLAPGGEDKLNKWFKQCTTTYFDFFIRIAIIYFVIFIIQLLFSDDGQAFINSLGDVSGTDLSFITIIMILALLIFAQRLPKLFNELFPSSSGAASFDFGLSPAKVFNNTLAAGLIGGAVGAVGAGASNAVHGYMNMRKAFKNNGGWKSGKAWGAALGAGLKGTASVAGGILGGAKAGIRTKDITKAGEAIKTANKNRTERELKAQSGYHWYNPLPVIGDKMLEFAGEPGATDRIKNKQQAIRDEKKRQADLEMGERLYNSYSKIKADGSRSLDAERAFSSAEYKASYAALGNAKRDAKKADLALTDAQAELNAARVSNDPDRIKRAKENYDIAYGNSKSMQGKLELAKAKHDSNKKIYVDDAEIEDKYKYYADTHAEAQPLNSRVENNDNTVIVEDDNDISIYDRVNEITGVSMDKASDNGAPTEDNSLLVQLAEEAHQKELQQEYISRLSSKGTVVDSGSSDLEGAQPQFYDSQENWDERIEYATEKLQELANNGASQEEIDKQLKSLDNLNNRKKQSKQKDDELSDQLDDFYDRMNDGFGGQ